MIDDESQTRKNSQPLCLKHLGEDTFGATLDITSCYPANLRLASVVRRAWLHAGRMVVVADQIIGANVQTIKYHWHGHAEAAWWVQDRWAQLHVPGSTLWISSPQVNLTGAEVRRLRGARGQVTLTASADVSAPVVWWVFFAGAASPEIELCENGLAILVNGRTFGFGKAIDQGETKR